MTRVNKGVGGGKTYLVCVKAKSGGGCRYHGIPYQRVEDAFLNHASLVIATAPAGDDGEEIEDRIDQVEANISGCYDFIENFFRGIETGGPATATERQKLRAVEDERDQLQDELRDLYRKRSEVAGPLVAQRLDALDDAVRACPVDRKRINVVLRQLLTGIVVDCRSGNLSLQWKHGGETDIMFAWPEVIGPDGRVGGSAP